MDQKLINLVSRINSSSLSVDKLCNVRLYLPMKEKIKLNDELIELVESDKNEFPNHKNFSAFMYFNLLVIKYYTNIEVDITSECFDLLQENHIFDRILSIIEEDYKLMMQFIQSYMDKGPH